ncbi:MAG: DUF2336 domain-containing protein [Allorhizobium sp.]
MVDQYRELEKPLGMRKRDVVLMATVTSFESVPHPTKTELRQFAELFAPIFQASTEEARRQAVAALSQNPNVPPAVALFIASQPIGIAAPFLASSPALSDDLLIMIARTQGAAHARAIVRRQSLSPTVIDALVGLRHSNQPLGPRQEDEAPAAATATTEPTAEPGHAFKRLEREEELRAKIKRLANHLNAPPSDRLGLRTVTPMQEALLVRFARNREADHFATTLAETLSSSRWLAERIMLDISGRQLAVTLTGIAMEPSEAAYVLKSFYPHLGEQVPNISRAEIILQGLDPMECEERVEAWRRADSYTYRPESAESQGDDAAPAAAPERQRPASAANIVGDDHARQVLRARQR